MRFFLRALFAVLVVLPIAPRQLAYADPLADNADVAPDTSVSALGDDLSGTNPSADAAAGSATASLDDPSADGAQSAPAFDYSSVAARFLGSSDLRAYAAPAGGVQEQLGDASWYDGEPGTCTHRTLPIGLVVQVTHQLTGATATCRITGWGPQDQNRVIDLSRDTFAKLADPGVGVIPVRLNW